MIAAKQLAGWALARPAAAALLLAAAPVCAQAPRLSLPIDCTLGETCFIEDYVDLDPAQGKIRDYGCGLNTRDGHKGTDIALLSFEAIEQGVAVLAAAPGRVLRTRDAMPDDRLMRGVTSQNACGNAVLVDHGDGWQGLYCHLRRGSVSVKPGDAVTAGDTLGMVGLSGQTTHPHVHLTLTHQGRVVDPFNPEAADSCGATNSLWIATPPYDKTLLRLAGFSNRVPGYTSLRGGSARRETIPASEPLVVYAEAGYAQDGDQITITATGPDGQEIFRNTRRLDNPKVSYLPAFGKKAPPAGWPTGDYQGQVLLTRKGRVVAHRWAHVTVTP